MSTKRKWSEDEMEGLRRLYPISTTPFVASILGRRLGSVQKQAQMHGIAKTQETLIAISKAAAAKNIGSQAGWFKPVHGQSSENAAGSTYNTWNSMNSRCYYKKHKSYAVYGGKGISVCDRWRNSFADFLADMGQRPPGTSLDRWPNHAGNYEPGNCRWATAKEQSRNTKKVRFLEAFGERKLLIEWA